MNNIFVEIYKRLRLVIRECLPIPQKTYYKTKKMLKTVVEEIVEKYFLRFLYADPVYERPDQRIL